MIRNRRHGIAVCVMAVGVIAAWVCLITCFGSAAYAQASDVDDPSPSRGAGTAGGEQGAKEDLRRRLQAHGVDTKATSPGPMAYLADVAQRFSELGSSWLSARIGGLDPKLGRWIIQGTRFLVVVAAILLVVLLVRRFADRPWQVTTDTSSEPFEAPPEELGVDHWQRRIEEGLSRGDAAAALKALWWWWACRLQAREVDPSWTTRELLRAVGRNDLRALGRAFDVLAYGTGGASIQEVDGLWQRLRGSDSGIDESSTPEPA